MNDAQAVANSLMFGIFVSYIRSNTVDTLFTFKLAFTKLWIYHNIANSHCLKCSVQLSNVENHPKLKLFYN